MLVRRRQNSAYSATTCCAGLVAGGFEVIDSQRLEGVVRLSEHIRTLKERMKED